jgi:hypothetical protein
MTEEYGAPDNIVAGRIALDSGMFDQMKAEALDFSNAEDLVPTWEISGTHRFSPQERNTAMIIFLRELALVGSIKKAAKVANVPYHRFRVWLEHDETFSLLYNQARDVYKDVLREEIHRRAIEGVLKPIFYQGEKAGEVREYSDLLLIFHAKAWMPEYRDTKDRDPEASPEKLYAGFDPQLV